MTPVSEKTIITFKPIGIIHTPFKESRGTPIQPAASNNTEGSIEIFDESENFSGVASARKMSKKAGGVYNIAEPVPSKGGIDGFFAKSDEAGRMPMKFAAGEYSDRLLDGFSHIILIYQLHLSRETPLLVKPFMDDKIGWLEDNIHKLHITKDDGRFAKGDK